MFYKNTQKYTTNMNVKFHVQLMNTSKHKKKKTKTKLWTDFWLLIIKLLSFQHLLSFTEQPSKIQQHFTEIDVNKLFLYKSKIFVWVKLMSFPFHLIINSRTYLFRVWNSSKRFGRILYMHARAYYTMFIWIMCVVCLVLQFVSA